MRKSVLSTLSFAGVLLGAAVSSQAQLTYPGCDPITTATFATQFKVDTLIRRGIAPHPTLAEPDKMDFAMDDSGYVDIYFTEIRPGNIKRYNAKTKTVSQIVKLPSWNSLTGDYSVIKNGTGNVEEGVTGIVLDPNFKTNKWLYVHWSPASVITFRISRFTVENVGGRDTILMTSEKILIDEPAQRSECCHTGGGMEFDAYGDLWFSIGNNGGRGNGSPNGNPPEGMSETEKFRSDEWGSSSTKGLRGAISRIHPDNSVKGYSIPAGNFGQYFAAQTSNPEYLDTSKVSPEIFIKGLRNPYTMALDPVRRWVAWGDVGPDTLPTSVREEVNLRQTPGFEGWPYFVGKNAVFSPMKTPKLASAPTNTSKWNTGMTTLPPSRPAFKIHTLGSSPVSGPIYRYDGDLQSNVKMPPHFNRKWFVSDWGGSGTSRIRMYTLNNAGDSIVKDTSLYGLIPVNGPMDFQVGPDGAWYISNYGTSTFQQNNNQSIIKVSYIGTCRPTEPKLEQPVALRDDARRFQMSREGYLVNLTAGSLVRVPDGMVGFQLFDVSGRMVWEINRLKPQSSFHLPELLRSGAFKYRWISGI